MTPDGLYEFRLRETEAGVKELWTAKASAEAVKELKDELGELRGAVERLRNMLLGATCTIAGSAVLVAATAIYLGGPPT